jgi:hypothetical protein
MHQPIKREAETTRGTKLPKSRTHKRHTTEAAPHPLEQGTQRAEQNKTEDRNKKQRIQKEAGEGRRKRSGRRKQETQHKKKKEKNKKKKEKKEKKEGPSNTASACTK